MREQRKQRNKRDNFIRGGTFWGEPQMILVRGIQESYGRRKAQKPRPERKG
jgi:hypothetical protein